MLNMSSVEEDRTARARLRDAALELFAEHGEDGVTMRQVADLAGVSPALVVHHFGSRAGLREAVIDRVRAWMQELFDMATSADVVADFRAQEWSSMSDVLTRGLPAESPLPRYVRRLLMTGDPVGTELIRSWHTLTVALYRSWDEAGLIIAGPDPETRAALTLSSDLGTLFLADHWREVLGYDPLTGDGLERWAAEATRVYAALLPTPGESPPSPPQEKP